MKFKCSKCSKFHKFNVDIEFSLPVEFSKKLHDQELNLESSDRWLIVENSYFFIKCMLNIPIQSLDEGFYWRMWIMVEKQDFLDFIELLRNGTVSQPFNGSGVIFAESTGLGNFYGETISYRVQNLNSYPNIQKFDSGSIFSNLLDLGLSKEKALHVYESIIHMYDNPID